MSLTPVSAPNYLAEARRVLSEVLESGARRDDIVDRTDWGWEINENCLQKCHQFGFRFLRFMQTSVERNYQYMVAEAAVKRLQDCRRPVLVAELVKTKFGIAEHSGLSYLAYTKLRADVPSTMLFLSDTPVGQRASFTDRIHSFLFVGHSGQEAKVLIKKNPNFIEFLKALAKTQVVILDCVLKVACP